MEFSVATRCLFAVASLLFVVGRVIAEEQGTTWLCKNGAYRVARRELCDGRPDCEDESDEDDSICGAVKAPCNGFTCKTTGVCLLLIQVCNFVPECGDGDESDEADCKTNEEQCTDKQDSCSEDPQRCYGAEERCNGEKFCVDGSDELNCNAEEETTVSHPKSTTTSPEPAKSVAKKHNKAGKRSGRKQLGGKPARGRRRGRKNRRKADVTREFWESRCSSWKACKGKPKRQVLKIAFKQCLKDPASRICQWKPAKRFSLRKCRRAQQKKKIRGPCENLTAYLQSLQKVSA